MRWCGPALVAVALWATYSTALAGTEEIRPFQLRSCNQSMCFVLEAPAAFRSPLDNIFVFQKGLLRLEGKRDGKTLRQEVGLDGYYDPQLSRIVLREVEGKPYQDVLVNLNNGQLLEF
ncbi:MAG: hypothetical protein H6624_00130 [Bdellovibrionaceae bacterium]|nr:hypothetical protein [Bdellovibrionales bacterium]MCB9082713.1 hypothetical protein [Pseudobdellovibrionaceae bacterium]